LTGRGGYDDGFLRFCGGLMGFSFWVCDLCLFIFSIRILLLLLLARILGFSFTIVVCAFVSLFFWLDDANEKSVHLSLLSVAYKGSERGNLMTAKTVGQ